MLSLERLLFRSLSSFKAFVSAEASGTGPSAARARNKGGPLFRAALFASESPGLFCRRRTAPFLPHAGLAVQGRPLSGTGRKEVGLRPRSRPAGESGVPPLSCHGGGSGFQVCVFHVHKRMRKQRNYGRQGVVLSCREKFLGVCCPSKGFFLWAGAWTGSMDVVFLAAQALRSGKGRGRGTAHRGLVGGEGMFLFSGSPSIREEWALFLHGRRGATFFLRQRKSGRQEERRGHVFSVSARCGTPSFPCPGGMVGRGAQVRREFARLRMGWCFSSVRRTEGMNVRLCCFSLDDVSCFVIRKNGCIFYMLKKAQLHAQRVLAIFFSRFEGMT